MNSGWKNAGVVVVAYVALLALPRAVPSVEDSGFYIAYLRTLPAVAMALAIGGLWGFGGLLRARAGRGPASSLHRTLVLLAGAGIAASAAILLLLRLLPTALPPGSYASEFDPLAWKAGNATESSSGGVAPRQRMLGDVVDNVLPGKSRSELEALLGPSEDSSYFSSTGRDLIYPLGPERGSYMGIDSEWLLVWLDSEGRYQRYRIAND